MLDSLRRPLAEAIAARLGMDAAAIDALLVPPAKAGSGDLALPCFVPAKHAGKPPPLLAAELAAVAAAVPGVSASAAGPFLNIRFAPAAVAAAVLPTLTAEPCAALRLDEGSGRTACIDFSSPNIAKHLAFHHIRSTMIGNALAHGYAAAGWTVVRINFLGDWGTAFGRLIAGWKREGLELAQLDAAPDKVTFLNDLYVRISRAADADPTVAEEARAWSKKLEDDDAEALRLWQIFKDASLAEFRKAYDLLGVRFDDWNGEAHYRKAMDPIIAELRQRDLLREDQGARVVDLSAYGMKKPCLIQRSDGGSLYATRDLAAADDRYAKYRFDRCLIEVDLGQSLHFQEWFAVAKLLGRPYAGGMRHVGHGLVLMWNDETQRWEKTATRKGVPMMLLDVLDEAIARAQALVAEKNPGLDPAEQAAIARAVGLAAVVFNDLKNNRKGDVKFKFEDALRFDGDTGPYLQYAHARLCSIERKAAEAGIVPAHGAPELLVREDEKGVLLAIAGLRRCLALMVGEDEPSQLAGGLLHLAGAVSAWLSAGNKDHDARVLGVAAELSAARVRLVAAARASLGEGLRILGLIAPQRM